MKVHAGPASTRSVYTALEFLTPGPVRGPTTGPNVRRIVSNRRGLERRDKKLALAASARLENIGRRRACDICASGPLDILSDSSPRRPVCRPLYISLFLPFPHSLLASRTRYLFFFPQRAFQMIDIKSRARRADSSDASFTGSSTSFPRVIVVGRQSEEASRGRAVRRAEKAKLVKIIFAPNCENVVCR